MKFLIYYLLQVILTSAILYGYYHIALRNKQFHRYNRFYLLAASVISVIIPFLNIPVYFTQTQTESSFVLHTLSVISSAGSEENTSVVARATNYSSWFTVQNLLLLVYILAAFIALLRIIFSLTRIRRIIHTNPVEQLDQIRFVNTDEPNTPFSFFRWLFWNNKLELHSEKGEQIFRHELFHIRQKHSWDIMYMELLTVVCWINPFFHLMKKEIKAIHEFLADEFAIKENKKWEYAELLLMQAFQTNHHLVNPFFHNQIKRRIAMITKSQKPSYRYLRKMMVLPLAAIAAALFAFSYKNKKDHETRSDKPITVVIDAGHGGQDAGARSADGTLEKDIVLAIAQKVKQLNQDNFINIVLTRDGDQGPALKSRTELAVNKNAALFLSLHVNTSAGSDGTDGNNKTGIEVYIPKKNKTYYGENRILGSILLNYFSRLYAVNNSIKQADASVWVLESSPCPSALIEFGYINNIKDLAFMKDPANQDKIARNILQTIDQYVMQKNSADWEERKEVFTDPHSFQKKLPPNYFTNDTTSPVEYYYSKNRISFSTGALFFDGDHGEGFPDINTSLIILENEKTKDGFIYGKRIEAKGVNVYPVNSKKALDKWGQEARKGVYQFTNVTVIQTEPVQKINPDTTKPVRTDNITFDKVEIEPAFPGGSDKWRQYLERNLDASVPVKQKAPDGAYTAVIQFIVDKDGSVSNVKALTKHGYGMEAEAIRVIEKGPRWEPAIQNGILVKAYKKQPITFIVGKGDKNYHPTTQVTDHASEAAALVSLQNETTPSFPGGDTAWKRYLVKNINAMIPVDSGAPAGIYKIILQFRVDKNGVISELKALTDFGYGMEKEAMRLISNGPKWIPATKDGKRINAYVQQTITFEITDQAGILSKENEIIS